MASSAACVPLPALGLWSVMCVVVVKAKPFIEKEVTCIISLLFNGYVLPQTVLGRPCHTLMKLKFVANHWPHVRRRRD